MYKELAVTSLVAAGLVILSTQYLRPERVSRQALHFLFIDVALFCVWRTFIYPLFFSPLRDLPGPKNYNFILGKGAALFFKPPGEEIRHWVNEIPNEGLLRFRTFWNQERLIPTAPETLKSVLSDHSYDYVKPARIRKFLTMILGAGLVLVEDNVHKFQRKNLLPAFQLKHIRELYPLFWAKSRGLIQGVDQEIFEKSAGQKTKAAEVEFGDWATRATLDIIGIAGLGHDFGSLTNPDDEIVRDYTVLLEPTIARAIYFAANVLGPMDLIQRLPFRQNRDIQRITRNLHEFCQKIVTSKSDYVRAKKGTDETDILSILVRSNNFGDRELIDQMLTFLTAGHETTSSALTWAVHLMAVHPEWQKRLRDEIRHALPSIIGSISPSATEIEDLPILNAICNETLRLYPTVPITSRESCRDTNIGGRFVPKGTIVLVVPWAINCSTDLWGPRAGEFRPQRWLEPGCANTGGASSNYCYMTFLHGPRSCIGQSFAKAEFKCLLAATVGRYKLEMADKNEVVYPAGVVTTKPANGMHLKMEILEGW